MLKLKSTLCRNLGAPSIIHAVVGVASPSFPCARQFGVIMHSGMKGGATITDSQPVIINNELIYVFSTYI